MPATRKWSIRSGTDVSVLVVAWTLSFAPAPFADVAAAVEVPTDIRPGDIRMDIGSMGPRPNLLFGWSLAENDGEQNYRWIKHLEADLRLDIGQPRDADLWIRAMPLYLPYSRQAVAVYLNHRFVADYVCAHAPAFETRRVSIPAELFQNGENILTLRMAFRNRVGGDGRELSLCVDELLVRFR